MIPVSAGVPAEIAVQAVPDDERLWVPQAPDVWFRPLMLNTVTGQWCNLLKVTRAGIVSRHRHPSAVFGYVIKGKWHYHEHDWVADDRIVRLRAAGRDPHAAACRRTAPR